MPLLGFASRTEALKLTVRLGYVLLLGERRVTLGGAANYHGVSEARPVLGAGNAAQASDIARAIRLVRHALYVWLAVIALVALLTSGWQHA